MKKFFVIIAVLALTMQGFLFSKPQPAEASEKLFPPVSAGAMAAVTFDGSIEFLMRSLKNTNDWNDATTGAGDYQNTYERIRIGVNAKNEGVKGRIQIETDWDQWGDGATGLSTGITTTAVPTPGLETRPTNNFYVREGWIDFGLGFGTAHVKVGRQFLQLGNGWFLRSAKYGSDAWLVGLPGKNTVAFVNIKASENNSTLADDTDAYALLDVFKIDDKNTVGAYIARAYDRRGTWTNNALTGGGAIKTTLDNIGLHYSGQVGPVKLQAEIDVQMGEIESAGSKTDLEGNQFVLQATVPMNALTINATLASGSGNKSTTANKFEGYVTFLDRDPHYTLVYEYLMATAAGTATNNKNSGFANTQAISIGAMYKINNMFTVGADVWMLSANEKVALNGGTASDDLGTEIDVKVNAKIADQLTWNTTIGLFQTGDAYKSAAGKADDVQAIQSVLSYKF